MELIRHEAPCDDARILDLWTAAFGADEAALEKPQIDGSEIGENFDFLYTLNEADRVVGTIHATIPRSTPFLCGLSGMCVDPAYRGGGLSRQLFGKIVEEVDAAGAEAVFLGTNNPVAAKIYASYGFAYLPGSNVMARFSSGGAVDFMRRAFERPCAFTVSEGSPRARIPLIPLVLYRGNQFLLDRNAKLFSSDDITQRSCMGLYPRYDAIRRESGGFFCAWNAEGILGAVASVIPTEDGARADFFCAGTFEAVAGDLLEQCRAKFGPLYFEIAACDAGKRACLEKLGYRAAAEGTADFGRFAVPCVTYR